MQVQPLRHGLRVAAGMLGHPGGAMRLRDVVTCQEALTGALMGGTRRQLPQALWRLAPAGMANVQQGGGR